MTQASDVVRSVTVELFHAVVTGIAWIEGALADLMTQAGVTGDRQKPVLTVALILLILAAFHLFGRIFGVLIAILLLLLLLQALAPDLLSPGPHAPR